jgi:hypothetical protein
MSPSRERAGRSSRMVSREEIEQRLDARASRQGETALNKLRDDARTIAEPLGLAWKNMKSSATSSTLSWGLARPRPRQRVSPQLSARVTRRIQASGSAKRSEASWMGAAQRSTESAAAAEVGARRRPAAASFSAAIIFARRRQARPARSVRNIGRRTKPGWRRRAKQLAGRKLFATGPSRHWPTRRVRPPANSSKPAVDPDAVSGRANAVPGEAVIAGGSRRCL